MYDERHSSAKFFVKILYGERKGDLPIYCFRMNEEEMSLFVMAKRETLLQEVETQDHSGDLPLADETPVVIKVHHLEEGRHVPIQIGGMVDVAIRELGAKVVKVEIIQSEEGSDIREE
jgi:hypothetical protein